MATVQNSLAEEKTADIPEEASVDGRGNPAEFNNNIQNGGHVVSTSSLQQNTFAAVVSTAAVPQIVTAAATNGVVDKDFSSVQNTTKPIPASMFAYRFASPTSNQTPYYVSSDIVLSGGMAQQTRRRIVHNEVERRRKDKINKWIWKLAQVVPQCQWGKQSKNIVLEKTVEYISQVNDQLKELSDLQQREQKLAQEVQHLKTRLGNVTKENKAFKDLLKKNNISIPKKIGTILETVNTSVAITTLSSKPKEATAIVTMATSKTSQMENPVTISSSPSVVTMVTQLPITTKSVADVILKGQSRKESVAYVSPFFIANNPVSMVTSTTSVSSVVSSVVAVAGPMVQNVVTNTSQHSHLQLNIANSSNLSTPNQGIYPQLSNNLVFSSTQQPVHTLTLPVCTSQVAPSSQTGFSQHSVAEIMKVAIQPGISVSGVVDNTSFSAPSIGNYSTAVFNVTPTVVNSVASIPSTTPHAVLVSAPSSLPSSDSFMSGVPGVSNSALTQAQGSSVSTFYLATAPNQNISVAMVNPINGSLVDAQQKASNDRNKVQGEHNQKVAYSSKPQAKPKTRSYAAKGNSQSKAVPENKTATNKRGAGHLPVTTNASVSKRASNCNPQDPQLNVNICQQPQEDIMTLQNFNVTALVPGMTTQESSSNNTVASVGSNRLECSKTTVQVSSIAVGQTTQVPRLSHSIASLAGLSQSLGQPQTPTDLQQHQQVSPHLAAGNLSFSAESLLASNEVVLPNIPHISTTSVPENNCSLHNSFTMAPSSSIHSTSNDQGHTQSFSNYSAETLIGGNEIIGEPVIAQDTQLQTRPSRTTYSDFSAESLIGSGDLNSGLSYAIDNLISSRSDENYNSSTMVSVNPNLLHSVKSNNSYDTSSNPLRVLAALPDLVEQKSSASSSQSTVLFSGGVQNATYGVAAPNSVTMHLNLNNTNSNRRLRESTAQQGSCQTVNSSNNFPSSSVSFLKHSVDSITSSFYPVSNAVSSSSNSSSSFQNQGSLAVEPSVGCNQLSFGSVANPFSPTRSFFNHGSTMGSFV